jgi:transcriptional regulator with XRE-family HTH domain
MTYEEVSGMSSSQPTRQLAQRLRNLREQHWPELRLTQAQLAAAFGDVAPATVSSWENPVAAKPPPPERLLTYARFFGTRRSIEGERPHLVPADTFSEEELAACEALEKELLTLHGEAKKAVTGHDITARRSWRFPDTGPLTIVCAQLPEEISGTFANPADPNYTVLQSFADLDALIELHGHIRSENPEMKVFFKASPVVVPDDLSGHLVLLGGIAWNEVTQRLSEMTSLPVRQIQDPQVQTGEIFTAGSGKDGRKYAPKWHDDSQTSLREDVGLLARAPNPLNSNCTLIICNGVHSRGVLGAVRSLTDAQLRESNERYIARNFPTSDSYAVLMRVPIIGDQAMTPDFNAEGSVLYKWP